MSSSSKSKSRSTGQPRSAGNEPLQYKDNIAPSERSAKPKKKITRKGHSLTSKGPIPPILGLRRNPSNSQSNTGNDKSIPPTVEVFPSENPYFSALNQKAATKAAKKKGPGNVRKIVNIYEKLIANQKGGKKTRKYKKSKKSKTRSKRC
jgi:hypothetical protein